MSAFNKLNLSTELLEFLQENHFKQPTPVQEQSILAYFKGESVDAISSTGTGKTLAFLLPIFEVLKSDERLNGVNELKNSPGAVILCPTRELAKQIAQLAKVISHKCRLRVRSLLTGENISGSIYDILITVPGKLQAAIKNKHVEAKNIRHLILDESDQLVEFGFLSEITHIYRSIGECQVGMFSATTMDGRDEFKAKIFGDKIFTQIECQQANILRDNIDTFNIYLSQNQKLQFLKDLIKRNSKSRGIVFVNKSETIIELKELLAQDKLALPVHFLSGKMDKKERLKVVEEFKSVKSVLICTDIMARGIDIPSIVWALNYDLPFEAAYYVHRCGRVGRAKNSTGQVFNFVTQLDQSIILRINIAITGQNALKLDLIKGPKLQKTQKKSTSSNKALNSVKIKRPLQKFKKRQDLQKENRLIFLYLLLFFLFQSCSSDPEGIIDKHIMYRMATEVDPTIEMILPKDQNDGVNCLSYSPPCKGGFKVKLRTVEMIILEYSSIKEAQLSAIGIDQYYYKNWVFDDTTGEPVLESFVKKVFNAKRPVKDEPELVKKLGAEIFSKGSTQGQ